MAAFFLDFGNQVFYTESSIFAQRGSNMKHADSYFDIYRQEGENQVFCYRSGLAVYEETFCKGVLVSSGWNAAGYPLNVLAGYPTRIDHKLFDEPTAFHVEINGQSIDYDLKFADFSTNRQQDRLETVLTLRSHIQPVLLRIHTLLDGTQMLTRWLEIENLSQQTLSLSRLSLLSGGLEVMDRTALTGSDQVEKLYSLGYFDADVWGREGDFVWRDLQNASTQINTRFGSDRFRHPLLFIRNNVNGMFYFCQIGWSAGCRFTVDYRAMAESKRSTLALQAEITGHNPMRTLRPGEVFTTPEVHMGAIFGSLDDAVNEMHDHIRKSVLCLPEADPSPCLIGAGMGAEHDMSEETTKAFIRQFAQMGGEVFILDAGWVCPPGFPIDWLGYNGENVPNPERYPGGMTALRDYCHSLGLKFGLWMEIERLGEQSSVYKSHPEWVAKDIYGDSPARPLLDLTVPEAAQWAEAELARVISEYGLDLLRVDFNVPPSTYFTVRDTGTGIRECLSLRNFEAVYRIYGNLKRRFPHVIFENCASGGSRTDLGLMKCFNHTWVSDWQRAPHSLHITNGMTMALPPERVDRLFAGMNCHPFGSLDLQMRNTMLTHMTLNVIAPVDTAPNPEQMAFVRHSTDIYKNFIRKFLPTARVFHHTPETEQTIKEGCMALEIASADRRQGAATVFTMPCCRQESILLIPRGLDPALTYRVTLDNSGAVFTLSGYALQNEGIRLRIGGALNSELVLFESI